MASIFIAVNGDDVGKRIGQAIASDDHASLQSASETINSGHNMINEWVESVGGKTITSSGDEGIYQIPQEAAQDLENIRQKYSQMSEHTLTIGVGSSMSEASKALIYGKLNSKDQIVEYQPEIESAISQSGEQDGDEELHDEGEMDQETSEEVSDPMSEEMPEENSEEMPEENSEEMFEDDSSEESVEESDPMSEEMSEEEMSEDGMGEQEFESEEPSDPMAEQGTDGQVDEMGSELDEEAQSHLPEEEGASAENHSSLLENMIQGHMDEEADPMMEEGSEDPMAEDGMEENSMMEDGSEEMPEESMEEEMPEEGMEEGMEEEMPEEEMPEEDGDSSNLKSDISQALMAFKQDKHILEGVRESNPQLYDATITMLRSMIDMARKLGFAPEDNMGYEEAEQEMGEEIPEEGMEESDESMEDSDEMSEEMPSASTPKEGEEKGKKQ